MRFVIFALLLRGGGGGDAEQGVFSVSHGAAVPQERACVRGLHGRLGSATADQFVPRLVY